MVRGDRYASCRAARVRLESGRLKRVLRGLQRCAKKALRLKKDFRRFTRFVVIAEVAYDELAIQRKKKIYKKDI